MSFFAHVETGLETYALIRPDGHLGGDALLEFLTGLELYLSYRDTPRTDNLARDENIDIWFSKVMDGAAEPMLPLGTILCSCYYCAGNTFDELALLAQVADSPDQREQAELMLRSVERRVVAINPLIQSAKAFYRLFSTTELEATSWYQPDNTPLEVQTLVETLELAKSRRAKQVRIRFS